uniref:CDGSH iron sulfur domain 1 n=1 Tax=Latimeria chalumnae TaxID=7897 RepID=H2ZVQ4_LATCH|nr:PREDICTED: CDGSH iron-sulfur domain-containing protein 1 [Latimeria chalumnae]|eukprot:XP_005995160.1 PREDICTED: CDGSH iron-sulfur domain-containing protein 1 [Latimeria chalumnae]
MAYFSGLQLAKVRWTPVVPVTTAVALGSYFFYRYVYCKKSRKSRVNLEIRQDSPKVVHSFDMEDIGSKAVYCRCWRSKEFPYCDGSHTQHNEETGDNVGPLIIKRKDT